MIKFKDLTIADKELVQSYTLWGQRQNCDLSFANLISWKFLYNTQYAIIEGYLVFRFYQGNKLAYMMPIAPPERQEDGTYKVKTCKECSMKVMELIREDSVAMGQPFLMTGVCHYMADIIEKNYADTFVLEPDRDHADYIYNREKLINLSGKKLQSKRNHINKFKKLYPDYTYKELTPELIPHCLELEAQWRRISKEDDDQANLDEELSEELRSMTRAFNRWDKLGLIGGTIWVNDELVAFTFGCPINQHTFDVCVEKADINFEGSFTIINQEFVKHLPEQYIFINREEDLGDEGLRKAKLSYKPDILLEKNIVTEREPRTEFSDHERVNKETRELWKKVFNDPEPFMDLYFSKVFKNEYNYTSQFNKHVVAALQAIPYTLSYHGQEIRTRYISGVSVDPDFRKQNIANNLMKQAHFDLYHKEIVFALLIPAEKWLQSWYGKCGYAQCANCIPQPTNISKMTYEQFDQWQRKHDCILLHDEKGLEIIKQDLEASGEKEQPQRENVPAMLRIINAKKALEMFAKQNKQTELTVRIQHDPDIPMNNAYYIIKDGKVRKTDNPQPEAKKLTVKKLAELIFQDEELVMNHMLND